MDISTTPKHQHDISHALVPQADEEHSTEIHVRNTSIEKPQIDRET